MKHFYLIAFLGLLFVAAADMAAKERIDIFFQDFETGDGGLVGTLDWEWGTYAWVGGTCDSSNYPPPTAYSGSNMWGTVLNDCYQNRGNNAGYNTCENTAPTDDSILSFQIDLTGYSDATLSFYEWFDLFLTWDWVEVYVNDTSVFQHCGGSFVAPTAWEQQTIDLTPFTGGVATIAFHMMASTVINHAGWYIDDVRVSTTSGTPTPTPTTTPSECLNTGDVNQDNSITAGDAQIAFMITLGAVTPTFEEACAADCNGSGDVTAGDAQAIFVAALGMGNCVDPL